MVRGYPMTMPAVLHHYSGPRDFRSWRLAQKLTQPEVANLLGVAFYTVSRWERRLHPPTVEMRGVIQDLTGIDPGAWGPSTEPDLSGPSWSRVRINLSVGHDSADVLQWAADKAGLPLARWVADAALTVARDWQDEAEGRSDPPPVDGAVSLSDG